MTIIGVLNVHLIIGAMEQHHVNNALEKMGNAQCALLGMEFRIQHVFPALTTHSAMEPHNVLMDHLIVTLLITSGRFVLFAIHHMALIQQLGHAHHALDSHSAMEQQSASIVLTSIVLNVTIQMEDVSHATMNGFLIHNHSNVFHVQPFLIVNCATPHKKNASHVPMISFLILHHLDVSHAHRSIIVCHVIQQVVIVHCVILDSFLIHNQHSAFHALLGQLEMEQFACHALLVNTVHQMEAAHVHCVHHQTMSSAMNRVQSVHNAHMDQVVKNARNVK